MRGRKDGVLGVEGLELVACLEELAERRSQPAIIFVDRLGGAVR